GLIVQTSQAGGHSATFTPGRPRRPVPLTEVIAETRHATTLPVIAAGGLATAEDVAGAVAAEAEAVLVGTALLRSDESGASATHRSALADPAFTTTVVTRAFTGRPARALRNRFIDHFGPIAPLGYPAVHHLTGPLRKAATAAGDTGLVHLWAGTGFRRARAEPAARALERLAEKL
ncbi:MAG: nitronate monooxygenase, partial [Stackebrandtia sp.]